MISKQKIEVGLKNTLTFLKYSFSTAFIDFGIQNMKHK